MALVLLGAGCTGADVEETEAPATDVVVEDDSVVEPRMIDFHNNHIPTFSFTYDDNAYTVATGPAAEQVEAEHEFLTVNDPVVGLVHEGAESAGLETEWLFVMKFVEGETDRDSVQAALPGEIVTATDAEVKGFDAYVFADADGMEYTAWPTPTGYYLLSVFDDAAQPVVDSLIFE